MKTVGIIAEFNPFHCGHAYMIEQAREKLGADRCVIVMSGAFTQRGSIACMYKYDRVRSALLCGADVIMELPVSYATATAEGFAFGAVSILNSLGCIDHLVFGAESDDVDRLSAPADILTDPPADYRAKLEEGLKKGLSYPAARSEALPEYSDLLSTPNNILAIEYIKALRSLGSDIRPAAILRTGMGYHDTVLGKYASAEAIRSELFKSLHENKTVLPENIKTSVPGAVFDIMSTSYGTVFPLFDDDLSQIAEFTLLTHTAAELSAYQDMNTDIANRFLNALSGIRNGSDKFVLPDFIASMRTKELTYTRLNRAMLHCILGLVDMIHDPQGRLIPCPYTRLLGFRSSASDLMHVIAASSSIPVINKAGDAAALLSNEAYPYHEMTVRSDRLADMISAHKYGTRATDGCRISPLII